MDGYKNANPSLQISMSIIKGGIEVISPVDGSKNANPSLQISMSIIKGDKELWIEPFIGKQT